MIEKELTKQDYQSALEIWLSYLNGDSVLAFIGYLEKIIAELEQPEIPMYKCIKLPHANGMFEIGNLYSENYCIVGFTLSELPFHFELVDPEPEKITKSKKIKL